MTNVKKQAKNAPKSKTDEQITQSVSQTPAPNYKRRIAILLFLSLLFLPLAFILESEGFFGVISLTFAVLAFKYAIDMIFPNKKPTPKNRSLNESPSVYDYEIKDGMIISGTGKHTSLGNR